MLNGLSVARIEVLLFPVASVMRPLDPTPLLQLHYEPSSLLRVGPPQCSASVRSPRGFGRLGFSLRIKATGSCSSAQQPASASRPLYAGRHPLSHQAPRGLIPGGLHAPGFDGTCFLNDASSKGLLSFVSRMHTCTSFVLALFLQRSPPRLFTAAAWSGLRSAPESRPRGAYPHLLRSLSHGWLVHGELLIRVLLQHTEPQEVERLGLTFPSAPPVLVGESSERDPARLLWMEV